MRKLTVIFIIISLLFSFGGYSGNNIQDNIKAIMNVLCSEECRGRVVGTKENVKAAEYIKERFTEINLEPFDNNSFLIDTGLRYRGREEFEIDNVVSCIRGTEGKNAIFLTAHFDHIEKNGEKLMGAVDNASGVAVLLETAKELKEKCNEKSLANDIIFAAYNAEETGLNGSKEFLKKYSRRYEKCYNINIDCVGVKGSAGLAMGNTDEKSQNLYNELRKVLDDEKIKYTDSLYATKNGVVRGTSDHQNFRIYGYPSIIIGDDNIFDIVHTTKDNLDMVDYKKLEEISTMLCNFIYENKYDLNKGELESNISSSFYFYFYFKTYCFPITIHLQSSP